MNRPVEASKPENDSRACPACGSRARRKSARFCATCGHSLGEGYFPTDSLRASYRFERRPAAALLPTMPREARVERPRQSRTRARAGREFMPTRSVSGVTATARAFVTYALVPYIGIIFCPGALLFGGVGYLRACRTPHARDRRDAAVSIALGLVVLCVQVALWWVLYKVPEWSRQSPF
ncbi:MAG TPA: hypothetical protein VEX60_18515 [Pyrinomonadaceae bacterium]|nr:hypothetical protein [Pyrinomonadaceae bacterium]